MSKTENLFESVDEWRRTQASHESHRSVGIVQTRMHRQEFDAIDVVGNATNHNVCNESGETRPLSFF